MCFLLMLRSWEKGKNCINVATMPFTPHQIGMTENVVVEKRLKFNKNVAGKRALHIIYKVEVHACSAVAE